MPGKGEISFYCIKHEEFKTTGKTVVANYMLKILIYNLCLFQVREVESGRVVYSESESVDVPIVTTTCDGQLLVVFYDGSHLVKVLTARAVHYLLNTKPQTDKVSD